MPILKADAPVFVEVPRADGDPSPIRRLDAGRLLELLPDGYVVRIPRPRHLSEAVAQERLGQGDLVMYFDQSQRFVRQCVLPRSCQTHGELGLLLELEISGDPHCAENRSDFRIATDAAQLQVALEGSEACPVLDISSRGFAVVSKEPLPETQGPLHAALFHEGVRIPGEVEIRNVCGLEDGTLRYGLSCHPMPDGANLLQRALPRINCALARDMVGRRAV